MNNSLVNLLVRWLVLALGVVLIVLSTAINGAAYLIREVAAQRHG